jgi:hypothetical protein
MNPVPCYRIKHVARESEIHEVMVNHGQPEERRQ